MQGVRGLPGIEEGVRVPSVQALVRMPWLCRIDPRAGLEQLSCVPWSEHIDHKNLSLICSTNLKDERI
jgi:ABC-type antimicrobial peptide transport system ATPase subunit